MSEGQYWMLLSGRRLPAGGAARAVRLLAVEAGAVWWLAGWRWAAPPRLL